MNARTETLAEVIDWLGDEADREWERAKDGLSDGYDGFELTIGKSEYLDEAASVDTPGDVFPYRFVSVLPDGRMSWEDVNYDRRKESFDVFREEFFQRLAEEYEYRADDKRRAWLALCDDEEAPLPDPPARKVAGYERMAAAIRGLAKETEEE